VVQLAEKVSPECLHNKSIFDILYCPS